jgi:triacylglycerol lipase
VGTPTFGTRLDDRALLRRQLAAAARAGMRPRTYVGAAKELALSAFHIATYPLGLTGGGTPVEVPFITRRQLAHPALESDPETARVPIVLLHGYIHNRSAFLVMAGSLRRAGFEHVHGLNYNPLRDDIETIAEMLAVEVDRVLAATGAEQCMIVGHSMGGIVARYYTQELAEPGSVDTVITLASPHRGTYTARLGIGPAAAQLRPRSALMRRLEEGARPSATRWISYYCDLDVMVTPAFSAKLVHPALKATNVRLRDTGHLSLLVSGEALRSIIDHLADRRLGRTDRVSTTTTQPAPAGMPAGAPAELTGPVPANPPARTATDPAQRATVDAPQPEAPAPRPETPAPQPHTPAPQPEAPAPHAETPAAPHADTSAAPHAETPDAQQQPDPAADRPALRLIDGGRAAG